ncbi:hypothetical protein CANINC_003547 [Pichia inconspicua]|uniref:Peptidase A1 domain-containing protein n=1 Tax=Pichia inconspicua TaxID=52247 RepID=A0A4T0WYF5_9ASCO|nr:hypothetical protein CANINC_003547 [[Candida] inconspicua]
MLLHTTILLSSLLCAFASGVPISNEKYPKVLKFPTNIRNNNIQLYNLRKRGLTSDNIVESETNIHQILLTFPLTLGGHTLDVVVDTGSRPTWIYNGVNDQSSSLCQLDSCFTSLDNINISNDDYAIFYRGNFGAFGKWSTADLSIGGSKPVEFKFGLANTIQGSTGSYSWAGFGYDSDSSPVDTKTHLIDVLKDGGAIDKRILEIHYNDFDNWDSEIMGHGQLIIGGYDDSKNYKFFDMVDNIKYYLALKINSVSDSNGNKIQLGDAQTAVFDSGSTSLLMKQKYKDVVLKDVKFDEEYPGFFACSDYEDYKLEFEIDPSSKISIPLIDISWNSYREEYDLCQLMIGDLPDDVNFEIAFGQYAMKNFDIVFDIDGGQLGLSANSDTVSFT